MTARSFFGFSSEEHESDLMAGEETLADAGQAFAKKLDRIAKACG